MLFYSILFVLLSNAVTSRRDKSILYSRITIVKSFIICYIIYELLNFSLNESIGLFAGLFHITSINAVFQLFIVAITGVILHLTAFYPRKVWNNKLLNIVYLIFNNKNYFNNLLNKMASQYRIIEYPLLLLFIVTGANLLVSCSDIVSIFLSIELQSYGLYLLCSLYRNSELSTSAGLTYFLLGGLSSCFILLGLSLLYVNSGTTNLDSFYVVMNLSNLMEHNIININYLNYMYFSLIIMSIGFLFKISAAPFHFWSPDVYDAIPTIVTTFVAIIAKISILVFLLEIIHYTSDNTNSFNWTIILLYSSILSLIIGTVLGLNQFRIKRLFAYSTISHLGFILLALSINSLESIQAFTFYLMQYSLSNLNAFMLLIAIGYSLYLYSKDKSLEKSPEIFIEKDNSPVQFTSQLKGFFYVNPILAISLAITIYSFVGIPPLVGFFAKQMVLSSAITNGYIFITFIAILSSVISAVYYLGIIKQLFFDNSNYTIDNKYVKDIANNNVSLSSSISIIISILTLIILLFMLNAQEWLSLTNVLSLSLFNL